MKKYLFVLITGINFLTTEGQTNNPGETFYIFKSDWSAAKKVEEAIYFARLSNVNDTCWQWDVYNYSGPMIKSEQYRDEKFTQLHGRQHYFKPSGYMDSSGMVVNGLQNGNWTFLNDEGRTILSKEYNHGVLVSTTDKTKEDTTEKEIPGLAEKESTFRGGAAGWKKYLEKNMNYPDRALKASAKGQVIAQFIVDTAGNITDADIYRSVEYSLDEETLRLIRKSPKWEPAIKDGKQVKSYKRQPLVFR